jgi:hypothetical protein
VTGANTSVYRRTGLQDFEIVRGKEVLTEADDASLFARVREFGEGADAVVGLSRAGFRTLASARVRHSIGRTAAPSTISNLDAVNKHDRLVIEAARLLLHG